MRQRVLLVMVLVPLVAAVESESFVATEKALSENPLPEILPNVIREEYIRHIYSIMNAYKGDKMGGHLIIQTNSQIDTRYKTWKRNADLINSLLALPKGMFNAGR